MAGYLGRLVLAGLAALLVAGCAYEAVQFRRFAQLLTRPMDIATTIEYRTSPPELLRTGSSKLP